MKLLDPNDPRTATVMKGVGTPEYAPLEQYGGSAQRTDARTDVYALGATLYHLLTGVTPPLATERVLDPTRLTPPRQLNPALSAAPEAALLRALALQPDQRYQSAREMRQALAGAGPAVSSPTILVQPLPGKAPLAGRRPYAVFPWVGGVGLALLLIAFLVFRPGGFLNPRPMPTMVPTGGITTSPATLAATPSSSDAPGPPTSVSAATITPGPAELTATAVLGAIEALTRMPTLTPMLTPTPRATPTFTPTPMVILTHILTFTPTVTQTFPSLVWISIPAGDFVMGSSDAEMEITLSECNATEGQETGQPCQRGWFNEPQRLVHVNGFEITKYEITNAQYKACEAAGVCARAGRIVTDNNIRYDPGYFADDYPVMAVNWHDAAGYCRWIGGRLPTEAEWEYAARGTDGRRYPWGNTFDPSRANLQTNFPMPVGSYPAGASVFGVLDMAGNVFEWTATEVNGKFIVRGGSWAKYYFRGRVTDRGTQLRSDFANYDIGFRCVR